MNIHERRDYTMITIGIKPHADERFEKISMRECLSILGSKMLHGIDEIDPKDQPEILITSSSFGSEKYFRF